MKTILTFVVMAIGLAFSIQAADVSVKLSDVHLCCQGCVKGVRAAVGTVQGVTVEADKDEGTVSLSGPDQATVQKAAEALVAGGYFGRSSDASIQLKANAGATGKR